MTTPVASLTVRKVLPCRPEQAFQAWTDPAQFVRWFPSPMTVVAKFDLRLGGKYQIKFKRGEGLPTKSVVGEFRVIDAPRRLEYTWFRENDPEWKDESVVKVSFNGLPKDQTEIVLTHELISDPEERQDHTDGWTMIIGLMAEAMAAK